jgi:hypothetical protein
MVDKLPAISQLIFNTVTTLVFGFIEAQICLTDNCLYIIRVLAPGDAYAGGSF